ncbi:MAG: hypothetical protein ACREHD_25620, partial [Pirellulales bacterium]
MQTLATLLVVARSETGHNRLQMLAAMPRSVAFRWSERAFLRSSERHYNSPVKRQSSVARLKLKSSTDFPP